ncbi:mitochondrial mRNA pseudouridine synthase RPUSD3 isoform X5 [Nannospalax galili]|uniref:mitochondrial mRNA pseudouridine synthase RPUSD3 isoform X5 n=1 Tax=Nannospalax galili TaxID=1026970 RepID=UPI00111C8B80|nr:mitochondrial mRNA pseudouridine synthase RPUSD3 isoform X5 [Nannospalax galili]
MDSLPDQSARRARARARPRGHTCVLCLLRNGCLTALVPGFGELAAGAGRQPTSSWRRMQPRGSRKPTGPGEDQPFPGLLRPENQEELADVLRAVVVDQQGPLVTLNKPQGLPITGKPGELTLLSALPQLSQSLGLREQELQIVRAPGKEASGLVLLSSCPQTASHLQKFFTHSRRTQRPTATYCAITNGVPAPPKGTIQMALKLEHMDGMHLDILEGVKRTLSCFQVMATGYGCALVQLQPLTGAHGSTALPSAWGPHLCCSCGHCPGPAFPVGSQEHQAAETGPRRSPSQMPPPDSFPGCPAALAPPLAPPPPPRHQA